MRLTLTERQRAALLYVCEDAGEAYTEDEDEEVVQIGALLSGLIPVLKATSGEEIIPDPEEDNRLAPVSAPSWCWTFEDSTVNNLVVSGPYGTMEDAFEGALNHIDEVTSAGADWDHDDDTEHPGWIHGDDQFQWRIRPLR